MEIAFWGSAAFIAYVYVGYPALLGVWTRVSLLLGRSALQSPERRSQLSERRSGPSRIEDRRRYPGVSVIVAARNEAPRLRSRISNLLASDYPARHLQIIVALDGSSEAARAALKPFGNRVELIALPPSGKAAALNAAVERARYPILVFADARQRFAADAIRRLVSHFRDPQVGAVSGELLLDCEISPVASTVADGVGAYWKYEKWLRRREAIVGSTLGVTGAIYAMRRWLWQPLPEDTLLDDVLGPMRVVMRGYRVIFDSLARAFDETAKNASTEMRRKVRTLAGNFQLLAQEPRLLVPGLNPVWLQFMSHKVGRLLVPYALIGLLVSSVSLASQSWLYAVACVAQLGFYGLAAYGAALERRHAGPTPSPTEVIREAA
jgi:cellulose synthase/poly-beta-1,6-N-acetylglucosamine synthase-like glycosyltransferase